MAQYAADIAVIDIHDPPAGVMVPMTDPDQDELLVPCVGDGSTDDTRNIQRFLNLARDGQPGIVLQFKPGAIYLISDTLYIHKGVGLKLIGGGLPHGGENHDRWQYTPKIKLDRWDDGAGGYDPKDIEMILVSNHAGLVIDGIQLEGQDKQYDDVVADGKLWTDRGIRGIRVATGLEDGDAAGINGAKHFYQNFSVCRCSTAWIHSHLYDDTEDRNGDSYHFHHCDFRNNYTGIHIDSSGDMQTRLTHVGFASIWQAIQLGVEGGSTSPGGQLYCDSIFLVSTNKFITTYGTGSNNMGIFVKNLKHDNSSQIYRPIMYTEGSVQPGSEGRSRGPVVFENIIMSVGVQCDGYVLGVENIVGTGKCKLIVRHHHGADAYNAEASDTVREGDWIHLQDTGVDEYDYPVSGTRFTVTEQSFKNTTDNTLEIMTDVDFVTSTIAGGEVSLWHNVTPIFRQLGGSDLTIKTSYWPRTQSYWDALFALSANSDWSNGRVSSLVIERMSSLPTPSTGSALGEYISHEDPENLGPTKPPWYRFKDCCSYADYDPPWSEANYITDDNMWTDEEKAQIRLRLGLDGTQENPAQDYPGSMPESLTELGNFLIDPVDAKLDSILVAISAIDTSEGQDWTDDEVAQIRFRLSIDGAQTEPAANVTDSIPNQIDALQALNEAMDFKIDTIGSTVSGIDTGEGRDWTDVEKEEFRWRLGISGATTEPPAIPIGSMAGQTRAALAAVSGKSTGVGGGGAEQFQDYQGALALSVTFDVNGNRETVTYQ